MVQLWININNINKFHFAVVIQDKTESTETVLLFMPFTMYR